MQDLINSDKLVTFPVNGKIPSIKNWNNLQTKVFHNPQLQNFGILTGKTNNILVIDCDLLKHDDPNKFICGVQFWNYLKHKHTFLKQIPIPTVKTKSGGLHLYFKYSQQLPSGIQQIRHDDKTVKIDVLSDNKFVVGPGSQGYKFLDNSGYIQPPELPTVLIGIFTRQFHKEPLQSTVQKESSDTQFISKERLIDIVDRIPKTLADNYQDWTKIVWAIAETGKQNGYDALDIADQFSQHSHKYGDISDVEKVYNLNNGSITVGTLIHLAKQNEGAVLIQPETDFDKDVLVQDLNKLKDMLHINDITGIQDEKDKKILQVVFSNKTAKEIFLFKDNLVTTLDDKFKGHLQNNIDVQYDLSIFHPAFQNKNCKGFFIDENTFDFLYKEENGAEHRIRLRNPYNKKKSCFTIHSYGKQLGIIQRNKQNISILLDDAIAPACHKVLTDRYQITVNTQNSYFNFGNQDEKEIRSEERFITDLIESHPAILDYMKFCNPNQSSLDGIYICSPQSGIWKKQHNSTIERMLTVRFKKYVPRLKEQELKFIETQTNLQSLRKMFIGFIVDDEFEDKIDENRNVFAMTNCVYDLQNKEMRKTNPYDFVFTNTGWSYNEQDAIKYLPDVEKFFKQLFPIKEEHDVAVTFFASLVHGYRLDKKFVVLTDKRNGNNGKSTLIALLRRFFGDYTKTSNKFLLKGSFDKDKDSHDGGLEPLKGKRILVCDELKKNMRLDEGLIKNLAGGEYTVEGRRLGKANQFKFVWQAGIVMIFNEGDCPKFDSTDHAFMERLVVVPMRSKFVVGTEDPETFTFTRDADIVDKFNLWKSALLKFFLRFVNKRGLTEVKIPQSMREWKEEILNENNELKDWLFSIIIEDKNGFVSLNDLRDRYRQAFPHDRTLKNKDVERMINALFNNKGVYLKEQHKCKDQNEKRTTKRNVYIGFAIKY